VYADPDDIVRYTWNQILKYINKHEIIQSKWLQNTPYKRQDNYPCCM